MIQLTPTKDDMGAAGGTSGGGDENPGDYNLPGGPGDPPPPPAKHKSCWDEINKQRGARPKNQYAYQNVSQHHKDYIPMSKLPDEKNGLPFTSKGTAETSFIEENTSGHVFTAAEKMATMEIDQGKRKGRTRKHLCG